MRLAIPLLFLFSLASGCQYILGIEDKDLETPSDDGGPGDDGSTGFLCDPIAQTGCDADEKCASVLDESVNPPTSFTECVQDGIMPIDSDCRFTQGVDDCVRGATCLKGRCARICPVQPGACGAEDTCLANFETFEDQFGQIGGCDLRCDPVFQDCDTVEGCYLHEFLGEGQCRQAPSPAPVQESPCLAGPFGCLLNGCDIGYGPHIPVNFGDPPSQCGFYCEPVDTFVGNTDFQGGNGETGIDCFASFGGIRPDGPGGDRQCRFLQGWTGNGAISEFVGVCVERVTFGDCGDCDVTTQTTAMSTCAPGCISKSFFDQLSP